LSGTRQIIGTSRSLARGLLKDFTGEARGAMEDRLQAHRQPMVTATGIILGFVLAFASSWVRTDSALPDWLAIVVFALILVGMTALVVVLSRILRMGVPADVAPTFYGRTLALFVVGVSSSALGILIDMMGSFLDV
jgi:hypothetical protein